jgi:hypothetical protein
LAKSPGKRREPKLELVGRAKPKLQARRASGWNRARETSFLISLAETCNVTRAAADAGVSISAAYSRRKRNAAFRAAWSEAIAAAYRRLELLLLDRAFNGSEKVVTRKDGSEERVREYPNAIALQLLKMHKDTAVKAEREHSPEEIEELREKLRRKLGRLRQRSIDENSGKA